MLTITQPSDNRIDIVLRGMIDADTMRQGLDELFRKSERIKQGRLLYVIPELALPTLGALGVELARLPKLFALLPKFKKCAVLTDAGWLKAAAEVEGALFPGLAIKSFGLDEREAAEAWLAAGK